MPPYLPAFETIPIAFVRSIHFVGERVKAFSPASFFKPLEFDGVKVEVIQTFPNAQIFYSIAVAHPIANN